jgi:ABC-type multidrug transport system permease subunit
MPTSCVFCFTSSSPAGANGYAHSRPLLRLSAMFCLFFFVMFGLFNGIVQPYSQLTVFWKYWMYWANPSQYWISGMLDAIMPNLAVRCAPSEAAYFNPPQGMTCAEYAGAYIKQLGRGYLLNPEATSNCGFCQYASGDEYLNSLNTSPADKWRNFGDLFPLLRIQLDARLLLRMDGARQGVDFRVWPALPRC